MKLRMQPLPERTRLSFPRFRIEERASDMAAIIVGFANTLLESETLLARLPHNDFVSVSGMNWWSSTRTPTRSSFVVMYA